MRAHAIWIFAALCVGPLALGPNHAVRAQEPSAVPQEQDEYDQIVDDFIQYDVGQLRGQPGQIANQRFRALNNSQAIPALCRGAIKASRIRASCPIIVISHKLGSLLRSTRDVEMLQHALDYLDPPGPQAVYGTYVNNLRQIAEEQMRQVTGKGPVVASTLRGGGTASQLRRSRVELDKWSCEDLIEAVAEEKGTRLLQVLEELKDRKGSIYTEALAGAVATVNDDLKPIARGLLATRLVRMKDQTLRAKLKDRNGEVRAAAALAIGYKGSPLYEELAAAMRDRDPLVAANARGVLVKMLGEDLGPPEGASGTEWFEASKRWEDWIEEHRHE